MNHEIYVNGSIAIAKSFKVLYEHKNEEYPQKKVGICGYYKN